MEVRTTETTDLERDVMDDIAKGFCDVVTECQDAGRALQVVAATLGRCMVACVHKEGDAELLDGVVRCIVENRDVARRELEGATGVLQ